MPRNVAQYSPYFDLIKTLLTLVVGGLLTIGGQLSLKFFDFWVSSKKETRTTRRKRLEDALRLAYQLTDWLDNYVKSMVFQETANAVPHPEAELVLLVKIYLKELEQAWAQLDTKATAYRAWALQAAQKRLKAASQKSDSSTWPDLSEGFNDMYLEYRQAFQVFQNKVVELALNNEQSV